MHVVLRDDGASTEPGIIDEEGNLPRPSVFRGLNAANNSVFASQWSFNPACSLQVQLGSLSGRARGSQLSSNLVNGGLLVLPVNLSCLLIDCRMASLVLGEVPCPCRAPVLL